jgi:hypothetical protein
MPPASSLRRPLRCDCAAGASSSIRRLRTALIPQARRNCCFAPEALRHALTAHTATSPHGIALAAQLVWDARSPIYSTVSGRDVSMSARRAREAIEATSHG